MKITKLERAVIESIFKDRELIFIKTTIDFEAIDVQDREFTGIGFLTEFNRSDQLKLFDNSVSLRWGKTGARLNTSRIETGYIIYIDDGYLTTLEGYTYGDKWPDQVDEFELYEIKLGMKLMNPPV